jgi:HEPN domain-containing protein
MTALAFEIWLQRARSNLAIAKTGKREDVLLEDLCFEAQLAAEKALKALLIYLGDAYPRTHAFVLLIECLEVHQEVPDEIREVIELSDYAVQMRYPGDYYPVSDEEYARAVDLASRVLDWVCLQIATQEEKEGRSEKREG